MPCGRAGDEKPNRALLEDLVVISLRHVLPRKIERWQPVYAFTVNSQEFPARGEYGYRRAQAYHRLQETGGGVDDMFAIVDHEEHLSPADGARQCCGRNIAAPKLEAKHARDGGGNQAGVRQRAKLDQPHVAFKVGRQNMGDLQRQRRLSDPAWTGQRDDPIGGHEIPHMLHGGGSADRLCRNRG